MEATVFLLFLVKELISLINKNNLQIWRKIMRQMDEDYEQVCHTENNYKCPVKTQILKLIFKRGT